MTSVFDWRSKPCETAPKLRVYDNHSKKPDPITFNKYRGSKGVGVERIKPKKAPPP